MISLFLYWFPFTLLFLFRCCFRFLFPFPFLFRIPVSGFSRRPFSSWCLDNKVYTFYSCKNSIKTWNPKIIGLTSGLQRFCCHPCTSMKLNNEVTNDRNISFYYKNTNEIQGELSLESRIFTCENNMLYLHMWKDHRCYGYIINRAFRRKKMSNWNGFVLHWCLYNK